MTELSALQTRVVAALFEVGHIRAIAINPATLDELTDIEQSLHAVATFFVQGVAADRAKDIELARWRASATPRDSQCPRLARPQCRCPARRRP